VPYQPIVHLFTRLTRVPYADAAELKFVLDEVALRRPEARKMNVEELIDNRFVKQLEDNDFVKAIYRGR
jgi:hypothetical protein